MIILFPDGVIRLSGWASPSTTRCFCTDGRVLAVIRVSDNSRAQRTTFLVGGGVGLKLRVQERLGEQHHRRVTAQ
jgi:hypothetical protein